MRAEPSIALRKPTLFPFLSVLVCLMGVLMFLAVAVALTSLESAVSNIELDIEWAGKAHAKKPVFLECVGEEARDLATARTFNLVDEASVATGPWEGTPFTDFLAELATSRKDEYVMFIVRPKGLATFERLREILVIRNQDTCTRRVAVEEAPATVTQEPLPTALAKRFGYADGELSFMRVMTAEEKRLLQGIFSTEAAKQSVEKLYALSQDATQWIDYGTELVPRSWNIQPVVDKVTEQ